MTEQIKPKQCGEKAWYIPNQKGFVPENGGEYFSVLYENNKFYASRNLHNCHTYDYAFINSGNCFETEKEAIDAFVKPVDPTPLTWDELLEMEAEGGYPYTIGRVCKFDRSMDGYVYEIGFTTERADEIRLSGKILFAANKYWRSKESLEAWIEQQKGE